MPHIAIMHVPSPALEHGERTHVARAPIHLSVARIQHASYQGLLARCGVRVVTLDVNGRFPDSVFVEDTAVVLDEVAIMACPGAPSRRGEPAGIEPELAKYRPIRRIELPATLEGGDVVIAGRTLLVGASSRTNEDGARSLEEHVAPFGYQVRRVPLRDCLHLKSACCTLPDGRLLINPAWLDVSAIADYTLVNIPAEEPFAADVATIRKTVIVSATNPRTADLIRSLGFTVHATPLSEFEKAEGGVTCLSIILRTP